MDKAGKDNPSPNVGTIIKIKRPEVKTDTRLHDGKISEGTFICFLNF